MANKTIKRILVQLTFSILAATVLSCFLALLGGVQRHLQTKLLLTIITIGGYGIVNVCCCTVWATRYQFFGILGMLNALVTLTLLQTTIWVNPELLKDGWKFLEILIALSTGFALTCIALALLHSKRQV